MTREEYKYWPDEPEWLPMGHRVRDSPIGEHHQYFVRIDGIWTKVTDDVEAARLWYRKYGVVVHEPADIPTEDDYD
jgi:hypothetical protein